MNHQCLQSRSYKKYLRMQSRIRSSKHLLTCLTSSEMHCKVKSFQELKRQVQSHNHSKFGLKTLKDYFQMRLAKYLVKEKRMFSSILNKQLPCFCLALLTSLILSEKLCLQLLNNLLKQALVLVISLKHAIIYWVNSQTKIR